MKRNPDVLLERFGRRVRSLRKAKGLSQKGFAILCGLDRTYVGGIERGERNVTLRKMKAMADALDISVAELTHGV